MTGEAKGFSICGTLMHTPRRGTVDIVEGALVEVGGGAIEAVIPPGGPDYARRRRKAEAAGNLVTLGASEILMPGLVDLHVHAPQWPQLGKALHLPLADWLQENTFPLEARYSDAAFARRVYASLVETLLANGTTTAVYYATIHLESSVALAEICLDKGQRALIGRVAMDHPEQCPDYYRDASAQAGIGDTEAFIRQVRALSGRGHDLVLPVVTPRFIPSCSDALLEGLSGLAADRQCHIQTHCSESDWEHGHVLDRFGRSDTESLDGFGLLSRHTILAHGNLLGEGDMDTIGLRGSGIAHCPLSNFYFSNAVFPLRRALDKGLHVGLGTDISGGHSASLFDACRVGIAASRALEEGVDPRRSAAERGWAGSRTDFLEAFWLATAGGGEVLGLPIGRLEAGFRFDAMVVDTAAAQSNVCIFEEVDGLEDVFQKIVYNATRANVRKVWVDGRVTVDKSATGYCEGAGE